MKNPEPVAGPTDCLAQEVTASNVVSTSDIGEHFDARGRLRSRRVETGGERVEIRRDGKTIAALVPLSDLNALETLEDRLDELDALEALADYRANGGVSFEQVMAEIGL